MILLPAFLSCALVLTLSIVLFYQHFLFLFEYIPLGIQIATMIVCFVALFTLVGRMEEKDAYTFAY